MYEKTVNELIKGLNRIVPVIGEKAFLYLNRDGSSIPLMTFVVDSFIKENDGVVVTEEEREQICKAGYFGLTILQKKFESSFAEDYRRIVSEDNLSRISLTPPIERFLKAAKPKLIITTSPFEILERLLPDYCSYYFNCEGDRDFHLPENGLVIYHLFGKAQQYSDDWVYNETGLLTFLHYLHDKDTSPENLADFLKNRGTLFLGCDFPDWMFRFLWYSISIKRNPQFKPNQTAGYWFGDISNGLSFRQFLSDINYRPQEDINSILDAVAEKLSRQQMQDPLAHSLPYDIFISHSGEDEDKRLCEKIADKLDKQGLRVWLDCGGQIEDGNYYEKFINGVNNSRFFMPIVTENYMIKFMRAQYGESVGLVEETKAAVKNMNARYQNQVYALPVIRVGERLYSFELNAQNIENRFASGENALLPSELFYHIQFFFYCEEDLSKDTFHSHNWAKYRARNK